MAVQKRKKASTKKAKKSKAARQKKTLDRIETEVVHGWLAAQPEELHDSELIEVIGKTLVDKKFRAELLENPQRLFLTGVQPLHNKKIEVLSHTEDTIYLVLPEPPGKAVRKVVGSKIAIEDKDLKSGKMQLISWNDDIDLHRTRDSKASDWNGYPFGGSFGNGLGDLVPNRDPMGDPDSRD